MESVKVTGRAYADACGAALALDLVGERWALLVMRELLLGPCRFGTIRRGLPALSANILTQRLRGLIDAGIVEQRTLAAPAGVTTYALTPWGMESEPVILALGRWALRSPRHDPTLPFSAVSLMLSMKMLLVAERAGLLAMEVQVTLAGEPYHARLGDGGLHVARGPAATPVAHFEADSPSSFLPVLYGGMPLAHAIAAGLLRVGGDMDAATRFAGLFALPEKVG